MLHTACLAQKLFNGKYGLTEQSILSVVTVVVPSLNTRTIPLLLTHKLVFVIAGPKASISQLLDMGLRPQEARSSNSVKM